MLAYKKQTKDKTKQKHKKQIEADATTQIIQKSRCFSCFLVFGFVFRKIWSASFEDNTKDDFWIYRCSF